MQRILLPSIGLNSIYTLAILERSTASLYVNYSSKNTNIYRSTSCASRTYIYSARTSSSILSLYYALASYLPYY